MRVRVRIGARVKIRARVRIRVRVRVRVGVTHLALQGGKGKACDFGSDVGPNPLNFQ